MKKVVAVLTVAIFLFSCGESSVGVRDRDDGSGGSDGDGGGGGGGGSGYTLTTSVSPYGSGSISRYPNQSSYSPGTSVSVTATAAGSNYTFTGWSGASTSTSSTITIVMDGNRSLTANFREQGANAVRITLTYWNTTETDVLGDKKLDPRIYFNVHSYQNGKIARTDKTNNLLDQDNLGQTWSGSSKSSPVMFMETASEVRIEAVVTEQDPLVSDDISPGYWSVFTLPVSAGRTGSATLEGGKSTVRYSFEFLRQ